MNKQMKPVEQLGLSPLPWKMVPKSNDYYCVEDANGKNVNTWIRLSDEKPMFTKQNALLESLAPALYQAAYKLVKEYEYQLAHPMCPDYSDGVEPISINSEIQNLKEILEKVNNEND